MIISENIKSAICDTFDVNLDDVRNPLPDMSSKLRQGHDLNIAETVLATSMLMADDVTLDDIAEFLKALHVKGETESEIATIAQVMREFADVPYSPEDKDTFSDLELFDCCGTGGGVPLFNISSAVAIVLAASGVSVAKHGNRSITSKFGSADFYEALGVQIDMDPAVVGRSIIKNRFGFLFAPMFHKASKNVQVVRKQLSHKTVFNILGPLTNPARPSRQTIGVYNESLCEVHAGVLARFGLKRAIVFHGHTPCGAGMDEVSNVGRTKMCEVIDGRVSDSYFISPCDFGLPLRSLSDFDDERLRSIDYICDILNGRVVGAHEEILALNAGVAFYGADRTSSIQEGIDLAREIMRSGKCEALIKQLALFSKNYEGVKDDPR